MMFAGTICPFVNSPEMFVNNSYVDKDAPYQGSRIKYTCQDGYIFPDGDKSKTITCLPTRQWNFIPPPCEGKCNKTQFIALTLGLIDDWGAPQLSLSPV